MELTNRPNALASFLNERLRRYASANEKLALRAGWSVVSR